MLKFGGVYPILYAFRDKEGRIDREALEIQIEACIAAGAHGIAILGLITEVFKLSLPERLQFMEWSAQAIRGRVPLAVTIAENSIHGQLEFAHAASQAGASWLILQPPAVKGISEADAMAFLGAVADRAPLPVGIQNLPGGMDVAFSADDLLSLHRKHPNISVMKAEGPAVNVAAFSLRAKDTCDTFGGLGGIEIFTNLRSGCVGIIPAPEVVDVQVRIFELWRRGTPEARAEAKRLHQGIVEILVFMTRGLPFMLCYGKRLMAMRLGIENHPSHPEMQPSKFGLEEVDTFFEMLGPLPGKNGELSDTLAAAEAGTA